MAGRDDLKVPKKQVFVKVFLEDGSIVTGFVFVSDFAETHYGKETVYDLLCYKGHFLTIKEWDTGDTLFVNKNKIVKIHLKARIYPELWNLFEERAIRLIMDNGESIEGKIRAETSAEKSRISDLINEAGGFLALETKNGEILVNTSKVKIIKTADEG